MLNNHYIGIDGFINGWCCCITSKDNSIVIELHEKIESVVKKYNHAKQIFVDMPIGLSNTDVERVIDKNLRELLPRKIKSSVFTPPCREALCSHDYKEANEINKKVIGKGISIQSWNLNKKINELDDLLTNNDSYINLIRESHPELCFLKFNKSVPLECNKKTEKGIHERIKILEKNIQNVETIIFKTLEQNKGSKIKKDDIIDSIILSISAKKWKENGSRIINQNRKLDSKKIPFAIHY